MKTVLMIAFHFPPFRGSSGILRTLRFCQYLPAHGWRALILSAHPRAYTSVGDEHVASIPPEVLVARPFALDAAKHLVVAGRYPSWSALPDRWLTWWLGAVPSGLRLIRRYRPDVLWSTYPIATAHLIGLTLHRISGVPWIADFRDAMTEEEFPYDRATRAVCRTIERRVVRRCARAVFTAPGTLRMYAQRYPELPPSRWLVIENGYDEESFVAAERKAGRSRSDARLVLLHSGLLYRKERDPIPFFDALAALRARGEISSSTLKVVLRASGNEPTYQKLIDEKNISDIVHLEPAVDYVDNLAETLSADGLLVFQGSICNHQIPAKVYECLRAGRPILGVTDPDGDTARLLRSMGIDTIVRLSSKEDIMRGLGAFLRAVREKKAPVANVSNVEPHSRESRTVELARLLESVS
jgi:glycosyltransferase involved in cell wall biosynthesis